MLSGRASIHRRFALDENIASLLLAPNVAASQCFPRAAPISNILRVYSSVFLS
jgi:hypothetical protein